jgi:hypothetical protein
MRIPGPWPELAMMNTAHISTNDTYSQQEMILITSKVNMRGEVDCCGESGFLVKIRHE